MKCCNSIWDFSLSLSRRLFHKKCVEKQTHNGIKIISPAGQQVLEAVIRANFGITCVVERGERARGPHVKQINVIVFLLPVIDFLENPHQRQPFQRSIANTTPHLQWEGLNLHQKIALPVLFPTRNLLSYPK
mmetsp:Transcript_23447/g.35071  ORF Transcript_23447/g.35071 Transcript_23447/m.35071 type:complete len:132 (-) Transcript_23447:326-721(-)